jgi:hypothetical protein
MPTHENEPQRESNRAMLAHVKEVMDQPRMSKSAREQEEEGRPDHGAAIEKLPLFIVRRDRTKGRKNNGKANNDNS